MIRKLLAAALLAAVFAPGVPAQQPASKPTRKPSTATRPSLVVFITIDQMRGDYIARFKSQLTGGLKRLADGGAHFPNGFQDHAITETAPGHASTMSGRFPVHTGITANAQGVGTSNAPLIGGATETGASPFRFKGTALIDWMIAADPSTRFLSVSRKDRGAILPVGRRTGDVYWWSGNAGIFTTSRYYADSLPAWVQRFNAQKAYAAYAGKTWDLLLPASKYSEPDTVWEESNGSDFLFPHPYPADPAGVAKGLANYPVMDSLTLAFALQGLQEKQLGTNAQRTDLLAISLSTTDAVGHKYGPDSREIHDQVLRVDRYLAAFLDSLFTLRDQKRIVIALTGDHGVSPYPEVHSGRYPNKNAKRVDLGPQLDALQGALRAAGVGDKAWSFDEGVFFARNQAAFDSAKVRPDSVARAFAAALRKVPGVLRADMFTDLAKANPAKDKIARRWLHMFDPGGAAILAVTLTPYSYWHSTNYATHGMPHDPDAGVPVLFWGYGVKAGTHRDEVRTVDMAPTLAAILGITPTETLDGVVLKKAVRATK
ncbi:MAG: alkaline phosphatase family protein [Gemmatimonadota bacterium]|nr:alkaline phosphatase family protein [Gemmatimonadota bacterium]